MKNRILKLAVIGIAGLLSLSIAMAQSTPGALADTRWQLVSYGNPEAPTPVVEGSSVTMEFIGEDEVSGSTGCNSYGGFYEITGDTILFEEVFSTLRACLEEAIGTQESVFLSALQTAGFFEVTGEQLVITYADGQQLVFAVAVSVTDTQWMLVSYGTADAPRTPLEGALVTLEFDREGSVGGMAGCNNYRGTYEFGGATAAFSQLVSTRRFCMEDGIMALERDYLAALQAVTAYSIANGQLTISYPEGQLVFAAVMNLEGTQWSLVSLGDAAAQTPLVEGSTITLLFGEDERVAGSSGCNSYGGEYEVDGMNIEFGDAFSTMMACEEALMSQETAYLAALGEATTFSIVDEQLVIRYGTGGELIFAPIMAEM